MTKTVRHIPVTIIRKYGYEYHLVEIHREGVADPCFFGLTGMALHSCKKIEGENKFVKKQKKSKNKLYNVINSD